MSAFAASSLTPHLAAHETARKRRAGLGLLSVYIAWIESLRDAQALREMEPRRARDMGIPAGPDHCPAGFAVDPRPLWGVGLTPAPDRASFGPDERRRRTRS